MSEVKGISLYRLQERIKNNILTSFPHYVWVTCEISAIKANPSGHCYLDVIDKDEKADGISARAQAIVWSSSWKILRPYFETTTGTELSAGMNILIKVQVQYSELYGLSLIIYDIDPSFTIGEIELKRRKIIQRLQEEGMFDMNSSLPLPLLPRRFAVISSDSAAGFGDFMNHLHQNEFGFKFYTKLFPAPMQGASAPEGIIAALEQIVSEQVDAVLILRGGGSVSDLSCFDDYDLAVNIAQFPIPVMTAIGHDKDYHVCDMVSCVSVKTPTALADYIVDIFASEDARLSSVASRLAIAFAGKTKLASSLLEGYAKQIFHSCKMRFAEGENYLKILEHRIIKGNPLSLLDAGYSLLSKNGKRVSDIDEVSEGDLVQVRIKGGVLDCKIENKNYGKS